MAAFTYKDYPFKITNVAATADYFTATNSTYEPFNESELLVKGTTQHKLQLKLSPYVMNYSKVGTGEIVDYMVRQHAHDAGLKLRTSTGSSTILDNGYMSVKYKNNNWTLDANSYVTGYTMDSNTGFLTVDMETVNYNITGANTDFNDFTFYRDDGFYPTPVTKRQRLRSNLVIRSRSRGNIIKAANGNEKIALETLRDMITEREFRKYLRYGFVLVRGESGATYQVFRDKWHIKVWRGGRLMEEICVRIRNDTKVPPTDNVIAFMTMIRADEEEFKKCGNVYNMAKAA